MICRFDNRPRISPGTCQGFRPSRPATFEPTRRCAPSCGVLLESVRWYKDSSRTICIEDLSGDVPFQVSVTWHRTFDTPSIVTLSPAIERGILRPRLAAYKQTL